MNMRFGRKIVETTYYDGRPTTIERWESREKVTSDSEELAQFIKLQQDHKASKRMSFEREVTDKGTRYVVKTWVD